DLTVAEMRQIAQSSFQSFPWRMKTVRTTLVNGDTYTATIEAQSSERIHGVIEMPFNPGSLVTDSILIKPGFFLKAVSGPPDVLKQLGLTQGQWLKLQAGQPGMTLADELERSADTAQLMSNFGFLIEDRLLPNGYKFAGTQQLGATSSGVYEARISANKGDRTLRVWVGTADKRIYKIQSQSSVSNLEATLEYDPAIKIEAPTP
ncbi:MAG TPA: hypothetical protein VLR94_02810, partial [Acidobacteriota bacterium]|nr:hypothetical protein [Acidobacteriota bacterium]